jgi:dTDP-4-dehydrorhamnose reductase
MTKSLVIGASGLIGGHLFNTLSNSGQETFATYHSHPISSGSPLDIRVATDLESLFNKINPDMVYLPGALPNVDYCEKNPKESYEINVSGVQNVVNAVNQIGAKIIFFSSDYIFDGKSGPYKETDPANPISEYGRQKLAAEQYITLHSKNYLIVRTTVVYGWEWQGKNFVYRLIKSLQEGIYVKIPIDQIGSPTYANNLAKITVDLASSPVHGIINIAGSVLINRYEFSVATARVFNLDERLIQPVKTEILNQPAKRPLSAGLIVEKVLGISSIPVIGYLEGLNTMAMDKTSQPDL